MASLEAPRLRNRRQTLNVESEREETQKKAFTMWVNHYLKPHGLNVKDLTTELGSGVELIRLAQGLTGANEPKFNAKPNNDIARLDNISVALNMLTDDGVRLYNTHKEHLLEGNQKIILGFIWNLIQRYQVQSAPVFERDEKGQAVELTAKEKLLRWVRQRIEGITSHPVDNFEKDFQDGIVYLALVHAAAPNAVSMSDAVDTSDEETRAAASRANLLKAFEAAETHLNIPQMLDPVDVLLHPDDLATMTYVSYFRLPPPNVGAEEELGDELEKLKKEVERLNGRVKELEGQLATSEEDRLKTLENIQVERDATQQQHNADLHERDTQIEDLKAEKEELRTVLTDLTKAKTTADERIVSLERDAKLWEEKVARLADGLKIIPALEEQLAAYKTLLDESDSITASSADALRKKEEMLKELNAKGKQLEKQTQKQASAMESLEDKIKSFEAQKAEEEAARQAAEDAAAAETARKAKEAAERETMLIDFLAQGSVLIKYTHHGKGKNHERFFKASDSLELSWAAKETSKTFKSITVRRVARGSTIPNNPPADEALCFTILSPQYSNLTLKARDAEEFEKWVTGLELLVSRRAKKRRSTLAERDEAAIAAIRASVSGPPTNEKSTPTKIKAARKSETPQSDKKDKKEKKDKKKDKKEKKDKKGDDTKEDAEEEDEAAEDKKEKDEKEKDPVLEDSPTASDADEY